MLLRISLPLVIVGILTGCASPEQPPSPAIGSARSLSEIKKRPYAGIPVTEKSISNLTMNNEDVGYSMIELWLDHHIAAVTLNAGSMHACPLYYWRLRKDEVVVYENENGTAERFRFKFLALSKSEATIVFPSGDTTTYRILH